MAETNLLKTLTPTQIEFVIARLDAKSDKAAAEAIGISPDVAYHWPNKSDVNDVVKLALLSNLEIAREKLARLTLKAVGVLDKEMDGDKRLDAACEVLDRSGLAAKKELDVTTGGRPLDAGYTEEQDRALILDILAAYGIGVDTDGEEQEEENLATAARTPEEGLSL